jgi:tRNA (cmo5U34)-methyltransferase
MSVPTDVVWRTEPVIRRYLDGVRGGIPLAAEQFDILLRLARAGGRPVHRFLDLGCGDGIVGAVLLGDWPEARGVFVDFAEPMLEAARVRLGCSPGQHVFCQADYGQPEWMDQVRPFAPFDVVVSGFSIHHQEDERKRELYAEILGLLEPGGLFLNLEHVASRSAWGEHCFDDYFLDALVAFHQRAGTGKLRVEIEREYLHREDKAANRLLPVEVQCDWLRELGFERVDCYFKVFELALFGGWRPGPSVRTLEIER